MDKNVDTKGMRPIVYTVHLMYTMRRITYTYP